MTWLVTYSRACRSSGDVTHGELKVEADSIHGAVRACAYQLEADGFAIDGIELEG